MDPVSKAQATGNSDIRQKNLRPWKKGQSGNPSGRPKKMQVTKMFERILDKPTNRKEIEKSLFKILTDGRMASVLLVREMAERTEGKVVQTVDMEVSGKVTLEQVLEAEEKVEHSGSR